MAIRNLQFAMPNLQSETAAWLVDSATIISYV